MNVSVSRALRTTVAWLAATLAGTAFAGAGDLRTVVVPLQTSVTYSAAAAGRTPALAAVVGYTVSVVNAGGNTINSIRLSAGTTAPAGAGPASFLSADGGNCIASSSTTIDCSIGQLKAGQAYPSFTLFFASPLCSVPGSCTTGAPLAFAGTTLYAEGTGGLDTSVPQNSAYAWAAADVALGTFNPNNVRSAVRRNGGALFTGTTVPTAADPLTTSVRVPAAAFYSKADISELEQLPTVDDPCTIGTALTRCVSSRITVLDPNDVTAVFSPDVLTITLRLDNSAVAPLTTGNGNKKPSVDQLRVEYEGLPVAGCVFVGTTPLPRSDGTPCIVSRQQYGKSRNGKDFPLELEDDYEWILINIRNGSYKIL